MVSLSRRNNISQTIFFFQPISHHYHRHLSQKIPQQHTRPPTKELTVPHLKLYIKLPFLGQLSTHLHKDLFNTFHKHLPQCKPLFIPHNKLSVQSFFTYKDKFPLLRRSSLVYKYTCTNI